MWRRGLLVVSALAVLLLCALAIRAFLMPSRQFSASPVFVEKIDEASASIRLGNAIQIKTVSDPAIPTQNSSAELLAFKLFLAQSFPQVFKELETIPVEGQSLLLKWRGSDPSLKPLLLAAHMDVVPAGEEGFWSVPPFAGFVKDGFIWGRGAMDDKVSLMGIMEAVNAKIKENQKPRRDVYLAFGHDEEVGGHEGAAKIAEYFLKSQITFELVLDEGMPIVEGRILKVNMPVSLVGIAEKGYLTVRVKVHGKGGHSSIPPKETPVTMMTEAARRINQSPMSARLTQPIIELGNYVAPEQGFLEKILFGNLEWLSWGVLKIFAQIPETNSMVRTTIALTKIHSGIAENVIPSQAEATFNVRILPGDSLESVMGHFESVLKDLPLEIEPDLKSYRPPTKITPVNTSGFKLLEESIHANFPDTILVPSLMMAGSDSKHYQSLSDAVLRHLPIRLGKGDAERFHGIDERIAISNYSEIIRFYGDVLSR